MESIKYRYDALNRLIEATHPDGSIVRYTYDPAGNRTSVQTFAPGEELPPVEPPPAPPPPPPDLPPARPIPPPVAPPEPKQKSNLRMILIVLCLVSLCACLGFAALTAWFWL
jgi:YD repeat-containing protein